VRISTGARGMMSSVSAARQAALNLTLGSPVPGAFTPTG
jgi:hypothetical protein